MQNNTASPSRYAIALCLFALCWQLTSGPPNLKSSADTIVLESTADVVEPVRAAHAHNDYWHERPLLDALDHGFCSVECDVFYRSGSLLVGHEESELRSDRSLESLYLQPLLTCIQKNNGHVYKEASRFFLFIDIKSARQPAYAHLREVLARYAEILTTWEGVKVEEGPVTVVITSAEPRVRLVENGTRYAAIDGRLSDLTSDAPAHEIPIISDRWASHFRWTGDGSIPPEEKSWLRKIVRAAHSRDRLVRFWGTPEKEVVWNELLDAEVDLINTDDLGKLERFLRVRNAEKTH